jgi:hypothetical protein
MLRVVLTYENSAYGSVCIKDDAVRKRLISRGTLGCDKSPDERAYAQGAMSPLGGCVRRGRKGRNSMGCIFLFFFENRHAKGFRWKYRRVRSIRQYC